MKAVILAGGFGTRISEETDKKPKPMIEIGGKPILWHIMKIYSAHGINDFVICCGYKGYLIKEYFVNYYLHRSDIIVQMQNDNKNSIQVKQSNFEPWNISLVDTGEITKTGGRLKRVKDHVKEDKAFCFTYGDGLSDINISELIKFHYSHGKLATLTATRPQGRYGVIKFGSNDKVKDFKEKPEGENNWINGGFFVLNPSVINRIKDDYTSWEQDPLTSLANEGQLYAFKHEGFWMPMDTLRDKIYLNKLWNMGKADWKTWK